MFEQTSRLAEKLAASVSRRGFLGSLGGWAATAAMGVAGVLAFGGKAQAIACGGFCCIYGPRALVNPIHVAHCKNCPATLNGLPLQDCQQNKAGIGGKVSGCAIANERLFFRQQRRDWGDSCIGCPC
jgi:hypothetical protein